MSIAYIDCDFNIATRKKTKIDPRLSLYVAFSGTFLRNGMPVW